MGPHVLESVESLGGDGVMPPTLITLRTRLSLCVHIYEYIRTGEICRYVFSAVVG